tara:strand:- start:2009 stop:2410 length:402 start_codon:yes stop_codon:yes gene_type:complete
MMSENMGCHFYNSNRYPRLEETAKSLEEIPPSLKHCQLLAIKAINWYMCKLYLPTLTLSKSKDYRKSNLFSLNQESKELLDEQKILFYKLECLAVEETLKQCCCLYKRNELMNQIRQNHYMLIRGGYDCRAKA